MSVLKIKNNDDWINVPTVQGMQGPEGPQGPIGPEGTLDANTMSEEQKKQLANMVGIPSKTSELTNDSGYVTQTEVDNQINTINSILAELATVNEVN